MKLFFVGDFLTNTGPGMANKMMRKGLDKNPSILYSDAKNKVTRVLEMIYKIFKADRICFCSPSRSNIIGIKIAKLLRKKTYYIMHGYLTNEHKINDKYINEEALRKINNFETYIFYNVDKVFCVSKMFMDYMKKVEPKFHEKFDFNYNAVDLDMLVETRKKLEIIQDAKKVVSIGGGMKQKNNITIAKAIDILNREKGLNLEFIVIGLPYTDKDDICSYDFVTYHDTLPHSKVLEILAESYLYVQNSSFDTFGLAVIEALTMDCNLLISKNVGAIGVLETISNSDLIIDTSDVDEIVDKIENLLSKGNAARIKRGIKKQEIQVDKAAALLVKKIAK